ncbi:N-acetylglucosamine-6-phosphate deacetylase [Paracoccus sp. PAR01]|uniref:N-acetylglucosamine-6-phosphate deacetylase n=1 Tax=Paracoccus sp. PAR01 TaxID=2769282 RepID=UPI00177E1141|nr:N-acetylglucosamine-6-phosphate deacetylase [Paracoccus sp. PAR01]MBD9527153.1 N-acetylglucosamine-6-phosphate deacetylase [Paracoccus sp. PAR01]
MSMTLTGASVFDGEALHDGASVVVADGRITAILPAGRGPVGQPVALSGGILAPGLLDLQVNGGGGRQVGASTTAADLAAICDSHARLGATGILPTLITDTPETTARVIAAGIKCAWAGVPGFLGLHLEGPHLDPRRKGAHDPGLIRPMLEPDLQALLAARAQLPALMVTLAPAAVAPGQIRRLVAGGVTVSLGHADCTLTEARAAMAEGARSATHLFNAMSPLGHREPGLVGAVLDGDLAAGLIADGQHVAPEIVRLALRLRPRGLYLVSDCMALAGTELPGMRLGGRLIRRSAGRLTLGDGTLAGADLTLPQALANLRKWGVDAAQALRMATSTPADLIGSPAGRLRVGATADLVHLGDDLHLRQVWRGGQPLLRQIHADQPRQNRRMP